MNPDRWPKVKEIFEAALAQPPGQRAAFIAGVCDGDEVLRREVESLLSSYENAGSFMQAPAVEAAAESLVGLVRSPDGLSLTAGQTTNHYEILSPLGKGGMGEVYLAHDTQLARKVALKLLPVEFTQDPHRIQRFQQEARAASALNHPNIITIYEIAKHDGTYFIATEFIDGVTLRQKLGAGPLPINQALDIAYQIALALTVAHEAKIIHRDIKPENVMIRRDGVVKVLDFGLAKLAFDATASSDAEATTLAQRTETEPGKVMGTVAYMSPEQARGLKVDGRTDIFSLGVVLYEMVAGRQPFEGATSMDVVSAILNQEPELLAQHAPEVPRHLERIVSKALRKNSEERYQTVRDLLIDLKDLKRELELQSEVQKSVPPSPVNRTESSQAAVATAKSVSSAEYIVPEIKQHKPVAIVVLAAIVLLSIIGFAYFFAGRDRQTAIDSIAVLPLVNASNDPNSEYLSDGIAESVISNLSRLPELKVMARTTVFRFKGKDVDPQKIGRDLNVRAVLTGRLLQQGESLVIRVELVNVADGTALWGGEYNRKVSDVLAVQQDISQEISQKLRLRLTGEEKERLTGRDTGSTEAYQFYLKGRYFWNKRTPDTLEKAIAQFQAAIDRDPNYAFGYVGLADCYLIAETIAGTPGRESLPKARTAADKALQLDYSLAEAHASSALVFTYQWHWAEAEDEFKRAIALNPNYATAHHWFGVYLVIQRRFKEALTEMQRAQKLDPLSPTIGANVTLFHLLLNDFDSALNKAKRTLEIDPNSPEVHRDLGLAYLTQQRFDEATYEFQKAVEASGRMSRYLGYLGYCYGVTNKHAEAQAILKELEEKYAKHESNGLWVSDVYVGLGDKDRALAWLEKDFEQRSGQLPTIAYRFNSEKLRSDPRFIDLLRRMGLEP